MTPVGTPDWVKDAVFYQIYPDTFARSPRVAKPSNLEPWDALPSSHGYKGGDLLGVVEHLDYLVDLGINALYFCPVFQSASNHRHHTYDYYRVDPMLGGDLALREFDTSRAEVREFLWDVATHWVELGIDGWRLDVPAEINDPPFWREFRRRVKAVNPDAYLVGEIWDRVPEWLTNDESPCPVRVPVNGELPDGIELDDQLARGRYTVEYGTIGGAALPARSGAVLQVLR